MIIVQLEGGLGNQLFQYALGRGLALRSQSELKLDLGNFKPGAYRPYCLGVFNLPAKPARMGELPFEFRQAHVPARFVRFYKRLPRRLVVARRSEPEVIRETTRAFEEGVMRAVGDVYLVGYWQSPKYFEGAASIVRSDLALTAKRAGASARMTAEVSQPGTVSMHIRRGDYATHPAISRHHGTCSVEYYQTALELLSAQIEVRAVYVFSDDIEWARRELRFTAPTVFATESGRGSDIRDFFLMSQCEHHVIANSTFSWWAAWLARRPEGQVVAPRRWFLDGTRDIRDLYPAAWHVL